MRDNDLELLFRNKTFEVAARSALFRMNEEINDIKRSFKEMAEVVEKMASVVTMLNGVADGMKHKIDEIMLRRDSDPRSTREIITSTDKDD